VISVANKGQKLNAYRVQDRRLRRCPQCGSTSNQPEDEFCGECGTAFSGQPVEYPIYLLRETMDRELLARQALIAEQKLRHPGMVNIYRAFDDVPYGGLSRFYLVSDLDEGTALATLPRPQPEEAVLTWSKQLAEALAYLHRQGVLHRNVCVENIRLVDSQARLTNFSLAEKAPKNAPKEWFAEEVEALARTMADLLAGQTPSPAVTTVFNKALAPDKKDRYATADALVADLDKALEVLRRPASVTLIVGRRSDVGQQRQINEDSLLTLELERVQQSESRPAGLYVVADGMGGHSAGELASALASTVLGRTVLAKMMLPGLDEAAQAKPDYSALLKEACLEANRAVYDLARKTGNDMGTTLVAALVVGSEVYVANIGDSRAYRVNTHTIQRITTDHSLVERLIATGQISKEEARTHPQRNLIYRTVGDRPQVEVDVFQQSLRQGDWLVLCTDGLHGLVEDHRIQQVVTTSPHPQAAAEELIRLANAAGGDDNITVIVVKAEEVGGTP